MHRVAYLFIRTELLSSYCFFEWSKHMEIAWGKVWGVWWMRKTLKMQVCDCCNCCTGSVGPCIVMLQKDS